MISGLRPVPSKRFDGIVDLAKIRGDKRVFVFVAGRSGSLGSVFPVDRNQSNWVAVDDRGETLDRSIDRTRDQAVALLVSHWLTGRVKAAS